MPLCTINAWADSCVGSAIVTIKFSGPPASTIAWLMTSTQRIEHSLADGWTLNTTAFPAATIEIVLLMIVAVGFVEGVIEPITPNGARSNSDKPRSPVFASATSTSVPGVLLATRRFLMILSS